jgi:hypothetical protein
MVMSGKTREKGFALIGVLLFLVLLSAMAVTLTYTVRTEKRIGGSDQEGNLAYYDAEAGMEKMTADLGALYEKTKSPKASTITDLGKDQPNLPGISSYKYVFNVQANPDGSPTSHVQTISAGDFAGLSAQIIPINLDVTATRVSGAQAHMTRDVEVAQVPVFQFGVFSDSDLSYFAGPDFDFGGRVHTNGDLYLAEGNGATLSFHDKITAAGEIIRQTLVNGLTTSGNYTGTVNVPSGPNGCPTPTNPNAGSCSPLGLTQGSLVGGKGSAQTPGWDTFALNTYNHYLVHQAAKLVLPFVDDGAPIEIIREPLPGEDPAGNLSSSRLYSEAQIRVLFADTAADLPGGAQAGDLSLDTPGKCFAAGCIGAANDSVAPSWKRPAGTSGDWSILGGWVRVEFRKADDTYQNVTQEWLDLGFSRGLQTPDLEHSRPNTENANAILILQQRREDPASSRGTLLTSGAAQYKWIPLNFYDTREGERRENAVAGNFCSVGGIMTATELDVNNLKRWLQGTIGTNGKSVESASQNGYILYYADHRGMLADPDPAATIKVKHGDFGFEDFVNPNSGSGASNSLLDGGEDVNGDGKLQTYGAGNLGNAFGVSNGDPTLSLDCSTVGRMNRVSGARHAIIIENGSLGNLPINFATGGGGFTVASEEPAYILGNYNANDASPVPPLSMGDPHASSAVIADTVTLLSKNWNNEQSMFNPRTVGSATCPGAASLASAAGSGAGRKACSTSYRVAIASGKSIAFAHPSGTGNDFGTDGGVHNFLRYLEDWGGQNLNYEGSLVSLYFAQYAVGTFKCCGTVYSPPVRHYAFDLDFTDPSKMPPGTPRFIDVVNVDMIQDLKPR